MDWLQRNVGEAKTTREQVLDEIKRCSVAAFENKDKSMLPSVQDITDTLQVNQSTVRCVVLKLFRGGEITKVQDGTLGRFAINYDVI